jgi:hypothetical protein
LRQTHVVEFLHQIAEDSALRTARSQRLLLQLFLEIRLGAGAHHNGLYIVIVIHPNDLVVRP